MMMMHLSIALAGPPPLDQLGATLSEQASKKRGETCTHDPDDASIRCGDGVMSLSNLQLEYRGASKKERKQLYKTWLSLLVDVEAEQAGADIRASQFRPLVKPKIEVDGMRRHVVQLGATPSLVTFPLTDSFDVTLVIDSEDRMQFASIEDVVELSLTAEKSRAIAFENLADVMPEPEALVEDVYMYATSDGYDNARFLVDGALDPLALPGDPVVLIAARDLVFVTGSNGPLNEFLALSMRTLDDDDLVRRGSLVPIVRRDETWVDLTLPDTHPASEALARIRQLQHVRWLQETRNSLAAASEKSESPNPPYVSKVTAFPTVDGAMSTLVVAFAGQQILPVVDYIGVQVGEEARLVPWKDFVASPHVSLEPVRNTTPPFFELDARAVVENVQSFNEVWKLPADIVGD